MFEGASVLNNIIQRRNILSRFFENALNPIIEPIRELKLPAILRPLIIV